MLLAKNPQICFDNPMRAGEVSYRAHSAGPCPDLTNDLRSPVSNLVKHTGRPLLGQALPFMRTRKPREGKGGRNTRQPSTIDHQLSTDSVTIFNRNSQVCFHK